MTAITRRTPARSRAALIATEPSWAPLKSFNAPDILPIGVRAPATITDPAYRADDWASSPGRPAMTAVAKGMSDADLKDFFAYLMKK